MTRALQNSRAQIKAHAAMQRAREFVSMNAADDSLSIKNLNPNPKPERQEATKAQSLHPKP